MFRLHYLKLTILCWFIAVSSKGGKVSVLITVSSHNPDIDRALQDIPHSILGEELPLHTITEPATQPVPVTQPIVAPKLVMNDILNYIIPHVHLCEHCIFLSRYDCVSSSQAKGTKSTSFLTHRNKVWLSCVRTEVDLVPLACEDGLGVYCYS